MEQDKKNVLEIPDESKYFTKISAEDREKVKEWLKNQQCYSEKEKDFLYRVKIAVRIIDYDFWIATLEPSVANGKIYYAEGELVAGGFSGNQYKRMAEEYAPYRGSRMAELHELFLWYALRIANGLWTLDDIVKNPLNTERCWEVLRSPIHLEKTGAKECGGYRDGQRNTYKIVTYNNGIVRVGGDDYHIGECYPIAEVEYCYDPNYISCCGSGVLVLTK